MTEEGGRFETSSLLRFLTSVSTQFSNSFQNHHNCLPDFNIASLIVVVSLIWMFGFVLNCSVNPEREGWGSRVADQFFEFFIVIVARDVKSQSKLPHFPSDFNNIIPLLSFAPL